MTLTLDEYILLLLLAGVKSWQYVKQIVGMLREDVARVMFCRYQQIAVKSAAGVVYVPGTLGQGSGKPGMLTNDEWFVMLAMGDTRTAEQLLQKIPVTIEMCRVIMARWEDIHRRYMMGWRAAADPSTAVIGSP